MRIQHNIAAMSAYRNYTNNTNAVSKNLEKLSSGYKINRAGDDAAGLAISEKMRAQIAGLQAASKNAKDGVSLVKTAEGALTEVHDMLNRMVTLATQSANGTYDNSTDRIQLQKEVDQLKNEINRIADSSNFNGIQLLDGSMSTDGVVNTYNDVKLTAVRDAKDGQVAAKGKFEIDLSQAKWVASEDGAKVSIDLNVGSALEYTIANKNDSVDGKTLAVEWVKKNADPKTGITEVTIDDKKFRVTANDGVLTFSGVDTSPFDISKNGVDAGNANNKVVVEAEGTDTVYYYDGDKVSGNQGFAQAWTMIEEPVSDTGNLLAQATFELGGKGVAISDGTTIKIGDETYTFAVGKNSQFKDSENVVNLTDYESSDKKMFIAAAARLTQAARNNSAVDVNYDAVTGKIYLTEKEGGIDRSVYDLFGADTSTKGNKDATWTSVDRGFVQVGQASRQGKALTLQIGDTSDSYNQLKVNVRDCHAAAMGIGGIDISTQAGAQAAVSAIKNAINYVSDVRGTLGATQNRLEHTMNNLSVMTENIQDAESTIRDTDIAEEMMAYTKNNILVQSAQAMLAQANQIPQGVLQLLG